MTSISNQYRNAALSIAAAFVLAACSSTVVRPSASVSTGSAAKYGASTVVQRGDTVYRIATSNGISPLDLAMWNGISAPYTIYPGQRLILYPKSGSGSRQQAARAMPEKSGTPQRSTGAGSASSSQAPAPTPAALSSNVAWRWPAEGALINRFKSGEPTRQGIDIAGAAGSPVSSAGDGIVVYSGSGLVGYGELIIIKHDEQWLSAYGHNRKRLVSEGQVVKVGQQIAELGRTGASRDMLHFEVRHNGKPVDPLQYLPRK
ncbi:MAG: peptidoglycan DD-metalloendopeptidase family protein [Pseudomonadota bacterium]|nr:peptidoglycan DD-metalloendopeptidase family protein [Pseudomonadota bacterium]